MTSLEQRFWAKVRKDSDCWVWTGAFSSTGYGGFKVNGRDEGAHRFSYTIHFGQIPPGLCVLHRCDNPACVRPAHLFLGTKGDNNRDRAIKGRSAKGDRSGPRIHIAKRPRGEAHPRAKLTAAEVRLIRLLYAQGTYSQKRLARIFHTPPSNIRSIVRCNTWAHVAA
jgi:hypothetical protein